MPKDGETTTTPKEDEKKFVDAKGFLQKKPSPQTGAFLDQVEARAKAQKSANSMMAFLGVTQEDLEKSKAKTAPAKQVKMPEARGKSLLPEDDEVEPFSNMDDAAEEPEKSVKEQKSLYEEVRDVLYGDDYAKMTAGYRRLADMKVYAQITRASYVEKKRQFKHWFNHTKFGEGFNHKRKWLKEKSSKLMDGMYKGYRNLKTLTKDGIATAWDATKAKTLSSWETAKGRYRILSDQVNETKKRFLKIPAVQYAVRKVEQCRELNAKAGKSIARNFRRIFGIRELTAEEKKARAEEKQKKAEEKAAAKQKKTDDKDAEKKRKKAEKEKLEAEKKEKKELEKKLKAFEKALKKQDPSAAAEIASTIKEGTIDGLKTLGKKYDKLMNALDLSIKSKIQKDEIDEIIRRRADKTYDARMKEFKKRMHENAYIDKKLKYRMDSDLWRQDFDAAKKRAEEKKGGKPKKEEKKEENTGFFETVASLKEKVDNTAKQISEIKAGKIGNAAIYAEEVQKMKTAYGKLQDAIKEIEEKKKAEAEAKKEAEAKAKGEEYKKEEKKEEKKPEKKSTAQIAQERTVATVNAIDNAKDVVNDVVKLAQGQGAEKELAHMTKSGTQLTKNVGSFFGWNPSKTTDKVDKAADSIALFGKVREDLTKRMKKIQEGKAKAEDYLAFENGITNLAQNCLSYGGIDTPYIKNFNAALKSMVEVSKGNKVSANVLAVGQQLLSTANEIEKKITGAKKGSLGTPIDILGCMSKVAGDMGSFMDISEQSLKLKALSNEELSKGLDEFGADSVINGRDDLISKNDLARYKLLGNSIMTTAETAAKLAGGLGSAYVSVAKPAFMALGKYINDAMQKSIDETLIRKDFWKTEDNYRIDRELGGMRNDEIMRLLRRETGSVSGKQLVDKIRFDLGMRLMTNKEENNGFDLLVKNALGREATEEEIMQLVGFKDFEDAEKRVYKAKEEEEKLLAAERELRKDAPKQSKEAKRQAKKEKAYQNTQAAFDKILDAELSKDKALLSDAEWENDEPVPEKKEAAKPAQKKSEIPRAKTSNMIGFTSTSGKEKNKQHGIKL